LHKATTRDHNNFKYDRLCFLFLMSTTTNISNWKVSGDWFDVCKCNIPCPCTFAQAPSSGDCAGILVWHIEKGQYSDTVLDGLNVLGIGSFTGSGMVGQASIFHLTGVVLNCSLKNPVLTAFIYFSVFSITAYYTRDTFAICLYHS
jgi:hypothetical protein